MTRRNQARSKPPPRRAYIASWDRAKREKNIKPRRKGGYRDTLGSRVVARLSTESKESTRFFFPFLYSFESPLISRGLRRRIFAGERRSQLKLSRIAKPLFPVFENRRISISRKSMKKDISFLRKIPFSLRSNLQKFCYLLSSSSFIQSLHPPSSLYTSWMKTSRISHS